MKKGRFLWSAHRITERQKAGKAQSIKGKQLKNSRNTVSKPLVVHHSSQRDNHLSFYDLSKPLFTRLSVLSVVFKSCKFDTVCNKYATYMQQNSLIKDAFNLKASFFFYIKLIASSSSLISI